MSWRGLSSQPGRYVSGPYTPDRSVASLSARQCYVYFLNYSKHKDWDDSNGAIRALADPDVAPAAVAIEGEGEAARPAVGILRILAAQPTRYRWLRRPHLGPQCIGAFVETDDRVR